MSLQKLILLGGVFLSLNGVSASAEPNSESKGSDSPVAPHCEDPLKIANAGERYVRARNVLLSQRIHSSQLDAAWSDLLALTELSPSGSFSLKDEILSFLSDSYTSLNPSLRPAVRDFLIRSRREEDLKTLLMGLNLCISDDEAVPCSPAKVAALKDILKKWGESFGWTADDVRTAAKDSLQAQIARLLKEDAPPTGFSNPETAHPAENDVEEKPWSLEDEESLDKKLTQVSKDSYHDVPTLFAPEIYETVEMSTIESDEAIVGLLREQIFPRDEDWRGGAIEIPESLFDEVSFGDLNAQKPRILRVLAIASSIMKNYLPVAKKELEQLARERKGGHPLVREFSQQADQRAYGAFSWVWNEAKKENPDPIIEKSWAVIRPVVSAVGIFERLLEIAIDGIPQGSELSPVLPINEEDLKTFLRSTECDKGMVDLVVKSPDTSGLLRGKLNRVR